MPVYSQSQLLGLSEIIPGSTERTIWIAVIKPGLTGCKASALFTTLCLLSLSFYYF